MMYQHPLASREQSSTNLRKLVFIFLAKKLHVQNIWA